MPSKRRIISRSGYEVNRWCTPCLKSALKVFKRKFQKNLKQVSRMLQGTFKGFQGKLKVFQLLVCNKFVVV